MIVYLYDFNGLPLGEYQCQIDPLESKKQGREIYLVPANCTETPPPQVNEGETVRFIDGAWTVEQPPEISEPTEPQPTELERLRADIDYLSIMTGVTL